MAPKPNAKARKIGYFVFTALFLYGVVLWMVFIVAWMQHDWRTAIETTFVFYITPFAWLLVPPVSDILTALLGTLIVCGPAIILYDFVSGDRDGKSS